MTLYVPSRSRVAQYTKGWPSSPLVKPSIALKPKAGYAGDYILDLTEGGGNWTREILGRDRYDLVSVEGENKRPEFVRPFFAKDRFGTYVELDGVNDVLYSEYNEQKFFAGQPPNITVEVAVSFGSIEEASRYNNVYILYGEGKNQFVAALIYYRNAEGSGRGLEFWVSDQAGNSYNAAASYSVWSPKDTETIYLLKGTYDGQVVRIFVDGEQVAFSNRSATSIYDENKLTTRAYFGGHAAYSQNRHFKGNLYYARLALRTDNSPLAYRDLWRTVFEPANNFPFSLQLGEPPVVEIPTLSNIAATSVTASSVIPQIDVTFP